MVMWCSGFYFLFRLEFFYLVPTGIRTRMILKIGVLVMYFGKPQESMKKRSAPIAQFSSLFGSRQVVS